MKALTMALCAAALFLGTTGCVAQREADDLRNLYRKAQGQIIDLQAQLEEKDAQIAALRGASEDASMADDLARAIAERDKLRAALADAESMLRNMNVGPLAPELSNALEELAATHPDLMIYDKDRGMVQLRSDLTFALGSATVRPEAASAINRLAGVLKTEAARPYEIRLVGHTDNVPVSNPANVQKYGDNWGLSAFRAIAVMKVFQSAGIAPQRMMVAGKGEFEPAVANGPRGAEGNRRVEIYLVATSSAGTGGAASSAPAATTPAASNTPTAAPRNEYQEPAAFK